MLKNEILVIIIFKTRNILLEMLFFALHLIFVLNCKIRLYHRDLYLGLLPDRDTFPTMTNYEVCQKFEIEFVDLNSNECFVRVKQTTNYCLDVAHDRGKALLYWSKHGGVNQRWTIVHGPLGCCKFKNENLCLEYLPNEDLCRMQNCSESENQLFNLIEDEDEDHGLATHANVTLRHDLDGNFVSGALKGGLGWGGPGSWGGRGGWGGPGGHGVSGGLGGPGGAGWGGPGGVGGPGWGGPGGVGGPGGAGWGGPGRAGWGGRGSVGRDSVGWNGRGGVGWNINGGWGGHGGVGWNGHGGWGGSFSAGWSGHGGWGGSRAGGGPMSIGAANMNHGTLGHCDSGHGNLKAGTIGHGWGINGGGAFGMGHNGWGNHDMGCHQRTQAYYDQGNDCFSP